MVQLLTERILELLKQFMVILLESLVRFCNTSQSIHFLNCISRAIDALMSSVEINIILLQNAVVLSAMTECLLGAGNGSIPDATENNSSAIDACISSVENRILLRATKYNET